MIAESKRSQGVQYAIREVVLPAKQLEKKGIKILHLNIGVRLVSNQKHISSKIFKPN